MFKPFTTRSASNLRAAHSWVRVGHWLSGAYKAVARFMIFAPDLTIQEPAGTASSYSTKARLYAYLPVQEEQRDWLDKLYHQS